MGDLNKGVDLFIFEMGLHCMGHGEGAYVTSKVHDFIKEFNAVERVRDWPVAHPQDTRSTPLFLSLFLSLVDCLWLCKSWVPFCFGHTKLLLKLLKLL